MKKLLWINAFFIICILSCFQVKAKESYDWEGDGSYSSPYLIDSVSDLELLRDLVNSGETFEGVYFRQTTDLFLKEAWIQIGIYDPVEEYIFKGIYDGYGHIIDGLNNGEDYYGYALFENFDGVIVNLGLTNVDIEAEHAAPFVFNTKLDGDNFPAIINCYSTGKIKGENCAGIAVNFEGGEIVNSISIVDLLGDEVKGILYSYNNTQIYHCLATEEVCDKHIATTLSKVVNKRNIVKEALDKSNIYFPLTQILYGNRHGVDLKKWFIIPDDNNEVLILYTDEISLISKIIFILNEYLLPVFLLIVLLVVCIKKDQISKKAEIAGTIIMAVLTLFSDSSAILIDGIDFSIGKIMYIILVNILFLYFAKRTFGGFLQKIKDLNIPLIMWFIFIIIIIAAVAQFKVLPRYDAALYYGSLVKSKNLFRYDLFTFMGAFICWKWAHGIVLLVEPFELVWPGEMTGLYMATLIIVLITYIIIYKLISRISGLEPKLCAIISGILIFCPYQMGMFTYFSMDNYLAYFAIWLMYSYLIENDYLIAFSGFTIIFTKDTGLIYYVVFLVCSTLARLLFKYRKDLFKGIREWWNWKRVIIWMIPGFLFLFKRSFGVYFKIQNYPGTAIKGLFEPKNEISVLNTIFDCFVWGFRWIFIATIVVAVILVILKKVDINEYINIDNIGVYAGTIAAMLMVFIMLLLYRGDAECPRYTAVLNAGYVVLFSISVKILVDSKRHFSIITGIVFILLLVQTYFTIDPSILIGNSYIETGGNKLYKLAFDGDKRPSMNIGVDYGRGYGSVGDIYAYNTQYNYYDSLIRKMLQDIQPDSNTQFVLLDVDRYELNIHTAYKTYWNPKKQRLTYNKADGLGLNVSYIISDELINADDYYLADDFYMIIPYRVDEADALASLENHNYKVENSVEYSNMNGSMRVLHIKK